jgi:hypothetical protein
MLRLGWEWQVGLLNHPFHVPPSSRARVSAPTMIGGLQFQLAR